MLSVCSIAEQSLVLFTIIDSLLCVVIVMAAVEHVTKLSRQNSAKKKISLGNCMDANCKNVVGSP